MIVPMKKYQFLVHHSDYRNFLQSLGNLGILHVNYRQAEPSEAMEEASARLKYLQETLHLLRNRKPDIQTDAGDPAPSDGLAVAL